MRVIVTNTALLNTGDAAIMLGTQAILERATDERLDISVRDQQPEVVAEHYREFHAEPLLFDRITAWRGAARVRSGVLTVLAVALLWRTPLRRSALQLLPVDLRREMMALAAADLIISAGGTYLVPHYRVSPKLLELLVARCIGRPYVLFTQSLGPFPRERSHRLLRFALAGARLILVRDGASRAHLASLGLDPGRIVECADAAFALRDVPRQPFSRADTSRADSCRVAVSVRHWPHFSGDGEAGMNRYLDAVAGAVVHLIEGHGAEVTFLSTCQGVPEYWTDDSTTADAVVARLPAGLRARVTVDRNFHRPEALLSLLAGFDAAVATRMHVVILALTAGTPVVPIAYEFKTTELFARLGLEEFVAEIETVTAERLCATLDRVLAHRAQMTETLGEKTAALKESAFAAAIPIGKIMETAS